MSSSASGSETSGGSSSSDDRRERKKKLSKADKKKRPSARESESQDEESDTGHHISDRKSKKADCKDRSKGRKRQKSKKASRDGRGESSKKKKKKEKKKRKQRPSASSDDGGRIDSGDEDFQQQGEEKHDRTEKTACSSKMIEDKHLRKAVEKGDLFKLHERVLILKARASKALKTKTDTAPKSCEGFDDMHLWRAVIEHEELSFASQALQALLAACESLADGKVLKRILASSAASSTTSSSTSLLELACSLYRGSLASLLEDCGADRDLLPPHLRARMLPRRIRGEQDEFENVPRGAGRSAASVSAGSTTTSTHDASSKNLRGRKNRGPSWADVWQKDEEADELMLLRRLNRSGIGLSTLRDDEDTGQFEEDNPFYSQMKRGNGKNGGGTPGGNIKRSSASAGTSSRNEMQHQQQTYTSYFDSFQESGSSAHWADDVREFMDAKRRKRDAYGQEQAAKAREEALRQKRNMEQNIYDRLSKEQQSQTKEQEKRKGGSGGSTGSPAGAGSSFIGPARPGGSTSHMDRDDFERKYGEGFADFSTFKTSSSYSGRDAGYESPGASPDHGSRDRDRARSKDSEKQEDTYRDKQGFTYKPSERTRYNYTKTSGRTQNGSRKNDPRTAASSSSTKASSSAEHFTALVARDEKLWQSFTSNTEMRRGKLTIKDVPWPSIAELQKHQVALLQLDRRKLLLRWHPDKFLPRVREFCSSEKEFQGIAVRCKEVMQRLNGVL